MKVVIISPGPSVRKTLASAVDCDACIAVNSGVFEADRVGLRVDYVSSGDENGLKPFCGGRAVSGVCVMIAKYVTNSTRHGIGPDVEVISWSQLNWHDKNEPISYSAIAALLLARHIGATEVHLYGYDMKGTKHADGSSVRGRNDWAKEWRKYQAAVAALERDGIRVIRHTAEAKTGTAAAE